MGVSPTPSLFLRSFSQSAIKRGWPILHYRIYRGLNETLTLYHQADSSVSSFNDTNVSEGVTYQYSVSAVNDVGEGELSEAVLAATEETTADNGLIIPLIVGIFVVSIILISCRWMRKR